MAPRSAVRRRRSARSRAAAMVSSSSVDWTMIGYTDQITEPLIFRMRNFFGQNHANAALTSLVLAGLIAVIPFLLPHHGLATFL